MPSAPWCLSRAAQAARSKGSHSAHKLSPGNAYAHFPGTWGQNPPPPTGLHRSHRSQPRGLGAEAWVATLEETRGDLCPTGPPPFSGTARPWLDSRSSLASYLLHRLMSYHVSQTLRNSTASSLILTNFCVSPFPAKIEIELISLDARGRDRKRQGWTLSFRCKGIFHSIGKPTWLPMEGDEVTWTGGGTPAQCSPANYDISRVAPHCS